MRDDPFSKLGALDQKLFQSQPSGRTDPKAGSDSRPVLRTESNPERERRSVGAEERGSAPTTERARAQTSEDTSAQANEGASARSFSDPSREKPFDLGTKPYRRLSFDFTDREYEVIEDVKLQVRRNFGVPITKNDIVRCAMGMLLSDLERTAERSRLVRELRGRK
jgi:hypothetical protein